MMCTCLHGRRRTGSVACSNLFCVRPGPLPLHAILSARGIRLCAASLGAARINEWAAADDGDAADCHLLAICHTWLRLGAHSRATVGPWLRRVHTPTPMWRALGTRHGVGGMRPAARSPRRKFTFCDPGVQVCDPSGFVPRRRLLGVVLDIKRGTEQFPRLLLQPITSFLPQFPHGASQRAV